MAVRIAISRLASIDMLHVSSGGRGAHFGEPVTKGAFGDAEPLGGADAVAAGLVERGADDVGLGGAGGLAERAGAVAASAAPARVDDEVAGLDPVAARAAAARAG